MDEKTDSPLPVAVYVHLGPNLPKHLELSLNRHKNLFPTQDLVLITSQDQNFNLPFSIQQFKVNTDDLEAELFSQMSQELDFDFRNGFWKYTLQRFFALGEFHEVNSKRALTHIESDVLLMPNFPWQKFAEFKKLAWLRVNSEIDVAAIVHLPTLNNTRALLKEISRLSRINPGTNDMLVLHDAAISLKLSHEYLPSVTADNAYEPDRLGSSTDESLSYFGGIFDPANLGIWYFGQDPKNSFGLRKRYVGDSSHELNPTRTRLKFVSDSLSDDRGTSVFSLHIHSKYLPLFESNWKSALEIGLVQALTKSRRYSLDLNALLQTLKGRKVRQNVWILTSLIPGLQQLRRIRTIESLKNHLKKLLNI